MRFLKLLLLFAATCSASGCYVVSVTGLADTSSSVFDETLLGRWRNAEDELEVSIERAEWRSYDVKLRDRTGEQRFTARLTLIGETQFFDLAPHAGTDPGVSLLPVHILGRVAQRDGALAVDLLDYDWFTGRLARGSLTTSALLDDREVLLLTAGRPQLRRWLAAHVASPAMFTEFTTLTRESEMSK
jgi:hypothetical protein